MSWGEWLAAYLACGFAFMAAFVWIGSYVGGKVAVTVGLIWPVVLVWSLLLLPGAILERLGWVVRSVRRRDDLSPWGFRRRPPSPPFNLPGWAVRCPWFELQLFKIQR